MQDFRARRNDMVRTQIAARGIRDSRVLAALAGVPRERFVAEQLAEFAYEDAPLPIEEGQTISQPYIVALMAAALELRGGERVLEIGTGSGYAAAVLAQLASEVYTVERHEALAEIARRRLAEIGYTTVHLRHADGTLGWPEHAPYDAIVVAAGGPDVPTTMREQLAIGGRLVMPVGATARLQTLVRVRRTGEDTYEQERLGECRFVPLVGEEGWSEAQAPPCRGRRAPRRARRRSRTFSPRYVTRSPIAAWITRHVRRPMLIGPDAESARWARAVADVCRLPCLVLEKVRRGDREVAISVPDLRVWRDHTPVVIDDIISTAGTMLATVRHLRRARVAPPVCIGVHGVFADGAYDALRAAGVARVVTWNRIAPPSNAIDVSDVVAAGVARALGTRPRRAARRSSRRWDGMARR